MQVSFNIIIKVIPYIFLGWLFTRFKFKNAELFVKYFINFALYVLIPIFTFFTMWEAPLSTNLGNTGYVVFAALLVFFVSILLALAFSKMFQTKYSNIALPIIFMNSASIRAIRLKTPASFIRNPGRSALTAK